MPLPALTLLQGAHVEWSGNPLAEGDRHRHLCPTWIRQLRVNSDPDWGCRGIAIERRSDLSRLGIRAMIGGNLAAFMSASLTGMIL
jgi:hypothetical protein